jgi:ribosomal protein S18 acetylase RimI-like enzyme
VSTECVRWGRSNDREALLEIVAAADNFSKEEKACAVELIGLALNDPDGDRDYRVLCAVGPDGAPSGYVCFGEADFARGTFDLYWIAVHPSARRRGTGRALLRAFERESRALGSRVLLVTTTARRDYEPAHRAYLAEGFELWARIPDYYADGEDQLIFGKRAT